MRKAKSNLRDMAGASLLAASVSLSFLFGFNASAEEPANLLSNPGAETQISADEAAKKINFNYMLNNDFLELADTVPDGWGAYLNGETKVKWGSSDKEFHSGKYSCFMTLADPLKSGAEHYDCILLSKSNGCSGPEAIAVEPGAKYKYSFWIKGDVEKITLRLFSWDTDDAAKGMKFEGLEWGVPISSEWTQIEKTLVPKAGVKRFTIGIGIGNAKAGQTIYVDDAVISVKPATEK